MTKARGDMEGQRAVILSAWRRGVFAIASATAVAACAILESDPNPPPLFTDAAARHVDADAPQDSGLDATLDASGKAGHDAGRDATGLTDGRHDVAPVSLDAGRDGRSSDASTPDGATHDATISDSETHDASVEAAKPSDASHDAHARGYCASVLASLQPVTFVACDDFDEDAAAYANLASTPLLSTATIQSVVSESPPNAAYFTADPLDGGTVSSSTKFAVPLASTYAIQFDLEVAQLNVPKSSVTVVALVFFQSGTSFYSVSIALAAGADAGLRTLFLSENEAPDGGQTYIGHRTVDFPATGDWTHVELTLSNGNGRWTYGLFLDGVTVDSNFLSAAFNPVGSATVSLGLPYVQVPGPRQLYVDNVLLEAR